MIENPTFGILHCTGEDAEKFLQGQLSANIATLSNSQGAFSCYLNLKGRVIATMYIIKRMDGFWLLLPRDLIHVLMHKLKKFIVFSKATLIDISGQMTVEGIQSSPLSIPAYHVDESEGSVTMCISPSHGLSLRIIPQASAASPLSVTFLKALFEAHIPWIGEQQSEQFLPHYINLVHLNAISFDKGCFVGQEIVARMQYKGYLNKQLQLIETPPAENDEIVNSITVNDKTYTLISKQ